MIILDRKNCDRIFQTEFLVGFTNNEGVEKASFYEVFLILIPTKAKLCTSMYLIKILSKLRCCSPSFYKIAPPLQSKSLRYGYFRLHTRTTIYIHFFNYSSSRVIGMVTSTFQILYFHLFR